MTIDEYQIETRRTANPKKDSIVTHALGIAGEGGEVADHIKKWLAQGATLDDSKLRKELGDLLWYIARMADVRGFTMSAIIDANVTKLRARYPDGFSEERSNNRQPGDE